MLLTLKQTRAPVLNSRHGKSESSGDEKPSEKVREVRAKNMPSHGASGSERGKLVILPGRKRGRCFREVFSCHCAWKANSKH